MHLPFISFLIEIWHMLECKCSGEAWCSVAALLLCLLCAHQGSTGGFLTSIPVILFDNQAISKCPNTFFVLSPHLLFVIYVLSVMIHG